LKTCINFSFGSDTLKIEQVATKIVQGPIPLSIFELPEGYTIEDKGAKKLEELRSRLANMTP
jgi:hypothetical protein